mgnify:CR=1 FL=1
MSIRRANDERIEGNPDGLGSITEIMDFPDAPTITAANVGTSRAYNNGAATVTMTAAATGGTPATYNIISTPGSYTASGSSPVTVTGLQSATSYTFQATGVTSTSVVGIQSAASSSITATTVPQAPTIGTVTVTNSTTLSVPFTEGATGGSAITSYTATSSPSIALSVSGTTSPLTVTGTFASGTGYTIQIVAVNANGSSTASSASNSVTPINLPVVTGGALTSDATYYYRTFTSNGTLGIANTSIALDILKVAGGGGGGGNPAAKGAQLYLHHRHATVSRCRSATEPGHHSSRVLAAQSVAAVDCLTEAGVGWHGLALAAFGFADTATAAGQ